jgi:hypothetical protein
MPPGGPGSIAPGPCSVFIVSRTPTATSHEPPRGARRQLAEKVDCALVAVRSLELAVRQARFHHCYLRKRYGRVNAWCVLRW